MNFERPPQEKTGIYENVMNQNRELFDRYTKSRIPMEDPMFSTMYKAHASDIIKTNQTKDNFEVLQKESKADILGTITEVFTHQSIVERKSLGPNTNAQPLSLYDDYFNGSDIGIHTVGGNSIMVGSIDVTTNVQLEQSAEKVPDGLHKKLERIAKHIEQIAALSPEEVNEFKVWYQSGGMGVSPHHDNHIQQKFERMFEKVAVLKYYKTALDENPPGQSTAVFGAPQIVLGFDNEIINKLVAGNYRDQTTMPKYFDALITLETRLALVKLSQFLKSIGTRKNYIFETYQIATDAWLARLSTQEFVAIYTDALELVKESDTPEIIKKQIVYYQKTLNQVFDERAVDKRYNQEHTNKPQIERRRPAESIDSTREPLVKSSGIDRPTLSLKKNTE
jgi:hypothetical protein